MKRITIELMESAHDKLTKLVNARNKERREGNHWSLAEYAGVILEIACDDRLALLEDHELSIAVEEAKAVKP
jgi:hypothetical protein